MKLTKPEYNENVTDVDGLEKLRIQQEGETDRKLILEQELTKRQLCTEQENTKRKSLEEIQHTKQGDNYLYRWAWFAAACAVASIAFSIAGYQGWQDYVNLEKAMITVPPCPKCPEVVCQPVPAK